MAWSLGALTLLAVTVGSAEALARGASLGDMFRSVPALLVTASPLWCGVGAGFTDWRWRTSGRRLALRATGVGDWVSVWGAAGVGLGLAAGMGLLARGVEASSDGLRRLDVAGVTWWEVDGFRFFTEGGLLAGVVKGEEVVAFAGGVAPTLPVAMGLPVWGGPDWLVWVAVGLAGVSSGSVVAAGRYRTSR